MDYENISTNESVDKSLIPDSIENSALKLITSAENVNELITAVKQFPIMKPDDVTFLADHSHHLGKVIDKSFMWRTDAQKRSILSDMEFPTTHSKFHQAMLEQKVQFEQTMYLAKDFEKLKLDIQLMECDLEDIAASDKSEKRKAIESEKIKLDMKFKRFELNQMQVQMNYRMAEIRGWQTIQDELLDKLYKEGFTDEEIWNKEEGEAQFLFLLAVNKLNTALVTNDPEAIKAVIPLALFTYQEAEKNGKLEIYINEATNKQKETIQWIGKYYQSQK